MKIQFYHDHYERNLSPIDYCPKLNPKTYAFELPEYAEVETEVLNAIVNANYVPGKL